MTTREQRLRELRIAEGINGTYFYHYSDHPKSLRALCGAQTMETSIPLSAWGYKDHLNERYCSECERLKEPGQ